MTFHLNSQTDLERAIHALVKQDPRLRPVFELAGMPALRRRDPGFAGLAAIVCGQQLSTASAAAIWTRVSAAFDPFHHETLRKARHMLTPGGELAVVGLAANKSITDWTWAGLCTPPVRVGRSPTPAACRWRAPGR